MEELDEVKYPTHFEYKGKMYYSSYIVEMMDKDPYQETYKVKDSSGEWLDAVIYNPCVKYVDSTDKNNVRYRKDWRNNYIRSRADFESKFNPVLDAEVL